MRLGFLFSIFILYTWNSICAQRYSIHGIVKDSLSGEALIGASVYIEETRQGTTTNTYGFYSISQSAGNYTIIFSYVGYKTIRLPVTLNKETILDVHLTPIQQELQEVIVTSAKTNLHSVATSKNELTIKQIKSIATPTGEPDVLKSLQYMPGIQAVNEGATNLYIRGGSYDQNLILLDEAPVYNPAHSLGFFSTFNTDAIKNVQVYKGAFPVQHGGRLSSVVDITMREGNYNKTQVNAGVGLIASRLNIEGPIIKEKASYMISGRYSYAGHMLNFLGGTIGSDILKLPALNSFSEQNNIWFYDLNAKINFKLNQNNHIYLSTYSGYDMFYCYALNSNNELRWGNNTSTLRWNHIFNGKLFSNQTIYYSNYRYQYTIRDDIRNFLWKAGIKEVGFKSDFTFYLNHTNTIRTGLNTVYHYFEPGSIFPASTTSIVKPYSLDSKRSVELASYAGNEQNILSWLSISYGLRYSLFLNIGPGIVYSYSPNMQAVKDSTKYDNGEIINSYNRLEPRISVRFLINKDQAVKFSYTLNTQYLHLLSNSTVGLPTDTWLPPDKYIKPQSSQQYALGYYRTFSDKAYEFSVEVYYKTLKNIIDYKDNAEIFLNKHIETQLLNGIGYSYGSELLFEKKAGKLTGWVGYTYSLTKYKIEGVNKNRYYSPRYDIRHNLSLTGSYEVNNIWTFFTTFKLASGGFITLPDQIFQSDGTAYFYYSSRNNYQLPFYHRLDLSILYTSPKNITRRYKSQWVFAVYNVYNRKNVYTLFVRQQSVDYSKASAHKMYLFGITPTISYNLSF